MSYQDIGYKLNLLHGGTIAANAEQPTDIVNLQTAQAILAGETNVKDHAIVASVANIDLATGGLLVVDGYQTTEGDRVLVKDQNNPVENGIYIASSGAWVRSADADEDGEIVTGTQIFVTDLGHDHAHIYVMNTTDDNLVIGTDPQHWVIKQAVTGHADDLVVDSAGFTQLTGGNAQTVFASADAKIQGILDGHAQDLGKVYNAFGLADLSEHFGLFSGSTLSDNADAKTLFQELETKAEATAVIYSNSKAELTSFTNSAGTWTTVTHGLGEDRLSSVSFFDESNAYQNMNSAVLWRPKSGDANSIEIYHSQAKTMTIVCRV